MELVLLFLTFFLCCKTAGDILEVKDRIKFLEYELKERPPEKAKEK